MLAATIFDVLGRGCLSPAELARLTALWGERKQYDDDLAGWLTRNGVFNVSAKRTLQLIQKGFIAQPDPTMLFASEGLAKLRITLAPPPEPRTTHPTVIPPPAAGTRAEMDTHWPTPETKRMDVAARVQVGGVLGKCLLTGVLGQGGHGMVFAALHQTLNMPVAVKVLLGEVSEMDPEMVRQLRREAPQTLARLNHPNVIRVLDFDENPVPYVVMEYAEGPSLADLLAQTGGLWVSRAVDVFIQVVRGLRAAWEIGVVHRDIKPGNILLTREGVAKLADLGLALTAVSGNKLVQNRQLIGTCAYMAPEQARTCDEVDFRADIYSLGATFYHCVTGRLPYDGKTAREFLLKHANDALVAPHVVAPHLIDEPTSALICRMMAKNPDDRFDSYEELLDAMAELPAAQARHGGRRITPSAMTDRFTQNGRTTRPPQ